MNRVLIYIAIVIILLGFSYYKFTHQKNSTDTIRKPQNWANWQTELEKHKLPCIKIKLENKLPQKLSQSKFGGKPYWPEGKEYPVDKKGKPLFFLAQINFSEITEKLQNYPGEGLLQFFISNDDYYGADFIDQNLTLEQYLKSPKNFAVIYHDRLDPKAPLEDINFTLKEDGYLPFKGQCAISLSLVQEMANPTDFRFSKITEKLGEMDDDTADYAYEVLPGNPSHKIGGYAFFSQDDPRPYEGSGYDWQLLFQMDTDSNDKIDIMWGDSGVANFFIRPEDLKNKDFSKVWYNWDCY